MKTLTYTYCGPRPSGVTLAGGQEVPLHPGQEVQLDPSHPYVKTLVALGHLREKAQATVEPTPKHEKGAKP